MLLQLLGHQLGQRINAIHAKHKVYIGVALAQLFHHVLLVGHTAAEADDEAGLFFFQALEGAHVAEHSLLGVFSYRAGVEEDEVCILRFLTQAVADIHQHALDALTVVDILLAAVAVNKCQRRRIVCLPDKLCGGIVMFKC